MNDSEPEVHESIMIGESLLYCALHESFIAVDGTVSMLNVICFCHGMDVLSTPSDNSSHSVCTHLQ
jgi:hypothetical protein